MTRTDTTLDQDRRTESNCVCMYTVQWHVAVYDKCEFQTLHDSEKMIPSCVMRRRCRLRTSFLSNVSPSKRGPTLSRRRFEWARRRPHSHSIRQISGGLAKTRSNLTSTGALWETSESPKIVSHTSFTRALHRRQCLEWTTFQGGTPSL